MAGCRRRRIAPALACLLLLAACSRTAPEQALREAFDGLQAAIEQRDAAAMQQHLADDFIGNDGMDRDGARRLAALMWMRHRDIGASHGPLQIELRDDHATLRFSAMLRGGAGGLPDSVQVYDVETGWRLRGGDWKLVSARWTPAL